MWTNRKMVFRFGLLYSGYAKDRWYWEVFVVARKIVLIFIVTFGRSNESQLHFAMGVLICVLYLQERGKPFEDHTALTLSKEKKQQHMLHVSEVGSLVVLLIMVWVAAFFNISPCSKEDWDCVFLSVLVFLSNLVFVAMCSYVGCVAFVERTRLDEKVANITSMFRKSKSVTKGGGAVLTMKNNPLANGKSCLELARQRAAAGKVVGGAEVELVVVKKNSNANNTDQIMTNKVKSEDSDSRHSSIQILKAEDGRKYTWNQMTGETAWLDDR